VLEGKRNLVEGKGGNKKTSARSRIMSSVPKDEWGLSKLKITLVWIDRGKGAGGVNTRPGKGGDPNITSCSGATFFLGYGKRGGGKKKGKNAGIKGRGGRIPTGVHLGEKNS